jgi:putative tricarboxylic transport membrane protein
MSDAATPAPNRAGQVAIGLGALAVAGVLAVGAWQIPSDAGYAGVGPDFLPWVMSAAMALCGALLVWQALNGGWRDVEPLSGAARGDWRALAWVAGAVIANASLITTIGFILSCTLCYALAVRGLRLSEGKAPGGPRTTFTDAVTGALIAAPVYWLFTKLLAVNLPGISASGWI